MDAILNMLTDPAAWFGGIFFGLVTVAIQRIFTRLPAAARTVTRRRRAARTRRIWIERRDPLLVTYAMGKANANYVVFILMVIVYSFALLFSPLRHLANSSLIAGLIVAVPVFVFELAWLFSDMYAKDLIKARTRLIKRKTQ